MTGSTSNGLHFNIAGYSNAKKSVIRLERIICECCEWKTEGGGILCQYMSSFYCWAPKPH